MKVGDRVKVVVSRKNDFFIDITGTVGTITEGFKFINNLNGFDFVIETDEGQEYLVFEEELELI
jgi:hypothetical protein